MSVNVEEAYLETLRAQTVLLTFAQEIRTMMHSCKANVIRLNIWSDYYKAVQETSQFTQRSIAQERRAIEKIVSRLPPDTLQPKLGSTDRLQLAHINRIWRDQDSRKLRQTVIATLKWEIVKAATMKALQDGVIDSDNVEVFRREEQNRMTTWAALSEEEFIAKLFAVAQVTDWSEFWETVAQGVSTGGPFRSGRECHSHWLHFHDPHVCREPWTKAEESALLSAVAEVGGGQWDEICRRVGTGRTVFDCYSHYQTALNTQLTTREWTKEQEDQLIELVAKYKNERSRVWFKVASHFPDKTNEQCRSRYERHVKSQKVKQGQWLCEEDIRLQALVAIFGRSNWTRVADHMPLRTDMKCRERYENLLAPELAKGKWTLAENRRLLSAVKELGPGQWSKVQECMPGRTDAECAKQWARLDPVGALSEGGMRALKCLFIPNQQKARQSSPALEIKDFQLDMAEQLEVLLKDSMLLSLFDEEQIPSQRKRARKVSYAPSRRQRLAEGYQEAGDQESANAFALAVVRSEMNDVDKDRAYRLALLQLLVNELKTGNAEADSQLHHVRKLIVRRREQHYGLPGNTAEVACLGETEKEVVSVMVQNGFDLNRARDESYLEEWQNQHLHDRVAARSVFKTLIEEASRGARQRSLRAPDFPD